MEVKLKVLITGASGRLGKTICSKFISENYQVVGFDLVDSEIQHNLYQHFTGTICDKSRLKEALRGCNYIIHSAVLIGNAYKDNPAAAFETNVFGTFILFESAREIKGIKIVLISSAPVDKAIFNSDNPFDWKSNKGEDHTYDLTKRLQEEIARDYSETFGISTIILRIGHVVDGKNKIDLDGKPLSTLEYCRGGWVDKSDVAEACYLAVQYANTNYANTNLEIFNVIGSHEAQKPFNIDRTKDKLGWQAMYQFQEKRN